MALRRPLVHINGRIKYLPTSDTLAGGAPAYQKNSSQIAAGGAVTAVNLGNGVTAVFNSGTGVVTLSVGTSRGRVYGPAARAAQP